MLDRVRQTFRPPSARMQPDSPLGLESLNPEPYLSRIDSYWSKESRAATGSLIVIAFNNPGKSFEILDTLIDRFRDSKQEQWNTLLASMISIASCAGTVSFGYLRDKLAIEGQEAVDPGRWRLANNLVGSLEIEDLSMVLHSGGLGALIRKVPQLYAERERDPHARDINTNGALHHKPEAEDLAFTTALIADQSPLLLSEILSFAQEEVLYNIANGGEPYLHADGISLIFEEIALLGANERAEVVRSLIAGASKGCEKGAELCGRILRRVEEATGHENYLMEKMQRKIDESDTYDEHKKLAIMASEFAIYNPHTAVELFIKFSSKLEESSYRDACGYAEGLHNLVLCYPHETHLFMKNGFPTLLDRCHGHSDLMLDEEERAAKQTLEGALCRIITSLYTKQDIEHATSGCLTRMSEWNWAGSEPYLKALGTLAQSKPKEVFTGVMDFLASSEKTQKNGEAAALLLDPIIRKTILSQEELDTLCLGLGSYETDEAGILTETLTCARRLRDYMFQFS